eukprot:COSAG02_NODE_25891_length_646_cov_0.981718_1_plen_106_part_00
MKVSALKRLALAEGIEPEAIGLVDDTDNPKAALISLVVAARSKEGNISSSAGQARLREELAAMKVSALKTRAQEVGVDASQLEEADDADDVKGAVVALIVEAATQ